MATTNVVTQPTKAENRSGLFDLSTVLTAQELEALANRRINLGRNGQYDTQIVTATMGMKLSDAGQLAVWLLRREAETQINKARNDKALAYFNVHCPVLLSKEPDLAKGATAGVCTVCEWFKGSTAQADVLKLLNEWQGEASKRASDKQSVLDQYQRAVGIIATFYGPSIQKHD